MMVSKDFWIDYPDGSPGVHCVDNCCYDITPFDQVFPDGSFYRAGSWVPVGTPEKWLEKMARMKNGVIDSPPNALDSDSSLVEDVLQKSKTIITTTEEVPSVNYATKKRGRPIKEGAVHRSTEYRRRKKEEQ